MTETISVQKARTSLGEVINKVYYRGLTFVVERKGKPMVKIVPLEGREDDIHARMKKLMKLAGSLPAEDGERMLEVIYRERKNSARGITQL